MLRAVCGGAMGLLRAVQAVPVRHTLAAAVLATGASVVMQARAAEDGASEDSAAAKSSDDGSGCEDGGCDKKSALDHNESDVCDDENDCDDCSSSSPDDSDNEDQIGDDTPHPVASDTGEKWEIAHDLVVKVKGRDFKLTRQYSSDPLLASNPYDSPYIPDQYELTASELDLGSTIPGAEPDTLEYQLSQFVRHPGRARGSEDELLPASIGSGWGFSNLRSVSLAQTAACIQRACSTYPIPAHGQYERNIGSTAFINRPGRKPRQFSLPTSLGDTDAYFISDPHGGPGNQSVILFDGFTKILDETKNSVCSYGTCGATDGKLQVFKYSGRIRFQEPGQWKQEFDIQNSTGYIVLDEDEYGNTRHYIDYDLDLIPDVILLNAQTPFIDDDPASPNEPLNSGSDAWIELYWADTSGLSPEPKLARAEVYRPDGSASMVTQYVKYYYLDNSSTEVMHWDKDFDPTDNPDAGYTDLSLFSGPSTDLGTDGDLVMVETYTAVDLNDTTTNGSGASAITEPNNWRVKVTQYRYHDDTAAPSSGDIRLRIEGKAHQLKMELMPQQVEFVAQRRLSGASGSPDDMTMATESYALLELDDGDEAFLDGSTSIKMYQAAAKIISYDRSQGLDKLWTVQSPVKRQFIQSSSSCGCGTAGTTNALMREYTQIDKWPASFVGTGVKGQSMHITEREVTNFSTEPTGSGYRTYTSDLMMLGDKGDKPYEWMVATIDNASGGRTWAHENMYDWDKRAKTGYYTSSAIISYTAASSSPSLTAPSVTHASTGEGLMVEFGYETVTEMGSAVDSSEDISTISRGGVEQTEMVRKTTHRTDKSYRHHLASEVTAYREGGSTGDDVEEVTSHEYGFRLNGSGGDTAQVGWEKMIVEREMADENGPSGSGNIVEMYQLFLPSGQLRWEVDADFKLTKYEYDELTGELTKIIRNADKPDNTEITNDALKLPSSGFFNSWSDSGEGELVTEFTRDMMGRELAVSQPGPVEHYTARELREDPDRPGILYYTALSLPHYLAGTTSPKQFDGPAIVSYMDAAGTTTRTESYELDGSASYAPASSTYTLSTSQLAQSRVVQDLSGTVTSGISWWDVANDRSYTTTYEHDGYGRLTSVTDGNGTITETAYDVLDRPIQISVGTSAGTDPVVDYIYDGDPAVTFTDPSDAMEIAGDQGVGNGNITTIIQHDGVNDRITRLYYDGRDRQIGTLSPNAPFSLTRYDNLDRVIESALYEELGSIPSASTVETASGSALGITFGSGSEPRSRYTRSYYSQRGNLWKREYKIIPSGSFDYYLESDYWYDDDGDVKARWDPSSPMVITEYDAHNRPVKVFITDRDGDVQDGTSGYYSFATATDESTDQVLEQTEYKYDDTSGAVTKVTHRARLHDTSATGDLSASSGANAITSYMGYTYDDAWRRQASINFGTNKTGSGAFSATAASAPTLTSYDELNELRQAGDLLYQWTAYNTRGLVEDVIGIQEVGTGSTTSAADIVTRYLYDDLGRTIAQVENADAVSSVSYNGTSNRYVVSGFDYTKPDTDRVTSFVYDGVNHVTKRVAHLAEDNGSGGTQEAVQVTQYSYGVLDGSSANPMDSLINSNNMLAEVRYPDESTGEPGTSDAYKVKYAYNRVGEVRGATDQNQTEHEYDRDLYGRVLWDAVTIPMGSDIDDDIERIGYSFDGNGRLETVTSYTNPAGGSGNIRDQVKLGYTPLWQVESVWQEGDGAVDDVDSPRVDYYYSSYDVDFTNPNERMNFTHLWSQVYPTDVDLDPTDGGGINSPVLRTLYYHYGEDTVDGSGDNIGNRVSRLLRISVGGWTRVNNYQHDLIRYDWIGMGRVALATLPSANSTSGEDNGDGIVLDRVKGHDGSVTAGAYPAFDRYGRVVEHRWVRGDFDEGSGGLANQPAAVETHHSYDRMSNRTTFNDGREGLRMPMTQRDLDYDGLNRLMRETRSDPTAVDSSYATNLVGHEWTLDMLGNWGKQIVDDDGTAGFSSSTDTIDSRSFNSANEIDDLAHAQYDRTTRAGVASPTYYDYSFDDNGNMTADLKGKALPAGGDPLAGLRHTYDAWNRLVKSEYDPLSGANKDVAIYTYNGLGWRTSKEMDISTGAYDGTLDQKRSFYYNASWQIVEEHVDTDNDGTVDWKEQQFWGARYIDDAIAKRVDRDLDAIEGPWINPDSSDWYQLSDTQFSVAAVLDEDGEVYERVFYDAYGKAEHRFPGDKDDSKHIDFTTELPAFNSGKGVGDTGYDPGMDANLDGVMDTGDQAVVAGHGLGTASNLGVGWISSMDSSSGPDNSIGYDGYVFNPEREDYTVRHRVYSAKLGRWMTRDPIEYEGGSLNLYQYVLSNPIGHKDPYGLIGQIPFNPDAGSYDPRNDPAKGCGITLRRRDKFKGHQWIEINDPANDLHNSEGKIINRPEGYGFWPADGYGDPWGSEPGEVWGSHQDDPDKMEDNVGTTSDGAGHSTIVWTVSPIPYRPELYYESGGVVFVEPEVPGGVLPNGTPTKNATCDQIRDCVRKAMLEQDGDYWSLLGNNCRTASERALKKCGLKANK